MKFNLAKYILPSVISMVLVGTYTNIDGLFIGNVAGDGGLAAINFAWPIVALITSVGTGIGVGGAVTINHLRGQNSASAAEVAKRTSFFLLLFAGLTVTLFCGCLYAPLISLMGAEGEAFEYAKDYALVVSLGALFQVMGAGLVVLLRNEGKTYRSMFFTLAGLVVHILLDVLLVEKYLLYGVAVSTILSQTIVAGLCLSSVRISWREKKGLVYAGGILKSSTAPFGLNFVPSAVLLFTNFFAVRAGGTEAVSAYAVMSYAAYTFDYIFQGVCDGVQPVVSYYAGARDAVGKRRAVKCSVLTLAFLSVLFSALTPLLISLLPGLFSVSLQTENYIRSGFVFYAFSYPLKASVKFICAYCYSLKKHFLSNVLTYLDPLIFTPLFLATLPLALGTNGIWLALPLSQAAVVFSTVPLVYIDKKRNKAGTVSDKTL